MSRKPFFPILLLGLLWVPFVSAEEPWGKALKGVKTRLSSLDQEHQIGKPLRLKLEITNAGSSKINYDAQQAEVNDSLLIVDANGKEVPYIAGYFQTGGSAESLAPNQVAVIFNGFQVDEQYCIAKAGKYSITFRGERGDHFGNGFFPSTVDIPSSNTLTIDLKPGKPSPGTSFAERLFSILPKGWEIERFSSRSASGPKGSKILIMKASVLTLECRKGNPQEFSPLILRPKSYCQRSTRGEEIIAGMGIIVLGERRENLDSNILRRHGVDYGVYLGKSPLGYVYTTLSQKVKGVWPKAEDQLRQALTIVDEQKEVGNFSSKTIKP